MKPGTGINGCGTYWAISEGATQTEAQNLSQDSWAQAQDNTRDATGAAWAYEWKFANYDTSAYPPVLP